MERINWYPIVAQDSHSAVRYGSDLTDEEWLIAEPFLPGPSDRGWPWRGVLDTIFYVLRSGLPWQYLFDGFPPWHPV
ncbi:transposase (plasmid) [Polymorphobacter sp. PAMC 29334]|uniref:transposase n=1 Tax=Polymorphobacter sp. PAMC 29334 TaxID=2862331 RepID=UPI001C7901E9|nr:transposase [Polymorphobacter sp. PAMC 29334]QYE33179.1 transposase [Polymorphobacter sp. PAMC 29334]